MFLTFQDKHVANSYHKYQDVLKRNNTIDFDDLLKLPVELFMSDDDIGVFDLDKLYRKSTPEKEELPSNLKTRDLLYYNIAAERSFKLEALEWLTDGKPKLFRSPGEGNYIVRLLNTSLTPNDTVGRMLHTFNCTAYEIGYFAASGIFFGLCGQPMVGRICE